MLAHNPDERYQHVGVILEDLASYEDRKLLQSADAGAFVPLGPSREMALSDETGSFAAFPDSD
jgi:hypothetical protein